MGVDYEYILRLVSGIVAGRVIIIYMYSKNMMHRYIVFCD